MRVISSCGVLVFTVLVSACSRGGAPRVEVPTSAMLDLSPFNGILVAGFIVGSNNEVDMNTETVRLLRGQLREKTTVQVIDADADTMNLFPSFEGALSLKRAKDVEARDRVFAEAARWKLMGDEYQQPLILTGALYFTAYPRGASLRQTLVFIDGRSGAVLHTERIDEHVKSHNNRLAPLAWYFRLMDRVVPRVLRVVSDQAHGGARTLLR